MSRAIIMRPVTSAGNVRRSLLAALAVVAAVIPFYADEFWLRTGFAVFAAVIGAVGLNLLCGTTGQLSLGHAFFLAVGAISYSLLAGESTGKGSDRVIGLGLHPMLAMIAAVVVSGLAGLLFSPVAARVRGLYLAVASLGLVVAGQHILNTATPLTGGFNGRPVEDFALPGFSFSDSDPDLVLLGVPFGQAERLWYLGLLLAILAMVFAGNIIRGRSGVALEAVRDNQLAAAVNGVDVAAYRSRAFLLSSMYAGLSGVLYALSVGSVAPESFTIEISVQYLMMIVLGGLGSVGGAAAGAVLVTALPLVLQQYSDSLPFLSAPGSGGVSYADAARYLYGAAVVLIVLLEPSGAAGLARRAQSHLKVRAHAIPTRRLWRGGPPADQPEPTQPDQARTNASAKASTVLATAHDSAPES
ncbi:branched-chain amino acid ABC transporter permease [Frankia sp. CcI49]|uniref:branched-chain amino acid ABC transporter permease n=1 Tax=Frankia sp. CcI49 TaxID=1745382 RepID=UPI0009761C93|nr:branched-chain amino acid ABC transporter permease [Frankia sp. CcI49]ONH60734.1 branched-chain amino acid ABC transporter permease [Frankia sp. CcI49]